MMGFLADPLYWWFFTIELLRYGAIFIFGCIVTHGVNILRRAA